MSNIPMSETKAQLVQTVKDIQRSGAFEKTAWYNFVLHQTQSTKKDPACHNEQDLQQFVDGWSSGEILPMDPVEYEAIAQAKHDANQAEFVSKGGIPGQGRGGGGQQMTKSQMMNNPMFSMMKNMMDMFTSGNGDTAMDSMMKSMGIDDSTGKSEGKGGKSRPGDWECPNCGELNFSRNKQCKQCGTSGDGVERIGMKKGDWVCPQCGDLVFARKNQCKMCGYERPPEEQFNSGYGGGGWKSNSSWSWDDNKSAAGATPY